MKSLTPVVLIALVVGAASGAAAGLLSREPTPAREVETSPPPTPSVSSEVLREVAELRQENDALRSRIAALENRPAPVVPAPFEFETTRDELAALARKVEELEETPPAAIPVGELPSVSPAFSAAVEETLQSIRKREQANKWRAGTEKAQERLNERLGKMQTRLDLTNHQVDGMRTVLTDAAERNLQLIQLWEEGNTPREVLSETKANNHRLHQEALANVLTPAQLQQYQAGPNRGGK